MLCLREKQLKKLRERKFQMKKLRQREKQL